MGLVGVYIPGVEGEEVMVSHDSSIASRVRFASAK